MGSRNGHAALAIWDRLVGRGHAAWRADARACLERARRLEAALRDLRVPVQRNVHALTVVFPTPEERIVRTHQLACDKGLAHAIVMPSVTDALLDRFVSDYASWWRGTTQLQVGAPLGAENARAPELAETGAAT